MDISSRTNKEVYRAHQIVQCKTECKERGISVRQWCEENHLSIKSYWYYHKKLGDRLVDTATLYDSNHLSPKQLPVEFAELVSFTDENAGNSSVEIVIGSLRIEVNESISDSFLRWILEAGSNV